MKHQFHSCDEIGCQTCDGGLQSCNVCHGAEGSLPTECPGRPLAPEEHDAIYAQRTDFKGGQWVLSTVIDDPVLPFKTTQK